MKILKIKRIAYRDDGTFGVLLDEGDLPFALSVELPWKDNKPFISCIPEGEYMCKKVPSPKFGITYEITGVPNRDHVLFHRANTIKDLQGCVGVGERYESLDGLTSVMMSKEAFNEFLERVSSEPEFKVIIIRA